MTGTVPAFEASGSPGSTPARRELAALLDRLEMWGQRLGLERIRELLARLGEPQLRVPVVLVAGTNGKGSTSSFLSAILGACGSRVGLYTSPHLESVEERIRVDGRAIGTQPLLALLRGVLEKARGMTELPTYFEAITAAAFTHFANQALDVAVVEVGLGGRLDATNASEPALSVITPIGFDHEEHLGTTLGAIAREKAGILRRSRPALASTAASEEVRSELARAAAEIDCGLRFVEDEVSFGAALGVLEDDRWRFDVRTPQQTYVLRSTLRGAHQALNLALAVRAAEKLSELGLASVDPDSIGRGVERARWPGRLESVLLPGGRRVLLDGAHNEAGIKALRDYLRTAPAPGGRELLFGALAGKRAELTLPHLLPCFGRVTLTEPPSPKALPAHSLRHLVPTALVRPSYIDALDAALEGASGRAAEPRELVVCGSLYLVGVVRARLRQRFGAPAAAVDVLTG